MNRITVRRLLDIQCEQKRSHDIDIEGHIAVCEKKETESCHSCRISFGFFNHSVKIPCERQKKT